MQTVRRDRKTHRGSTGEQSAISKYGSSAYCLSLVVHGQDMHVSYHLVLGIPHHLLRRLHRLLKEIDAESEIYVPHKRSCTPRQMTTEMASEHTIMLLDICS
jgi:fatty acid desaturase